MADSRVHVHFFARVVGRIRLYKDPDGKWRVERCEEDVSRGGLPFWQLYAVRDHWQQAWVFAGWLSGKRDA